jgi:hypothetical protein
MSLRVPLPDTLPSQVELEALIEWQRTLRGPGTGLTFA